MKHLIILCLAIITTTAALSQGKPKIKAKKMVKIGSYIELMGPVSVQKDNIYLTADNGKQYDADNNEFEFTGNVRVNMPQQGEIYSDKLLVKGEMYRFRQNVRLVNEGRTLTTNNLDYNSKTSSGYFYDGGLVQDSSADLRSRRGYYYPKEQAYLFVEKVTITTDGYILSSDSLRYNTKTSRATVFTPTEIRGDSTFVYCENGWYNTKTDEGLLTQRAFIQKGEQTLSGDTIIYNKAKGYGKATGNVKVVQTTDDIIIKGGVGYYYEASETAIITQRAMLIQAGRDDSLYMHADTLYSISVVDSEKKYQMVKAYHNVKIFRTNLQAMCDSLQYSFKDSVIHMFVDPIVWSDNSQLTAQQMRLRTHNNEPDVLELDKDAFLVTVADSSRFDQIKGNSMTGFFVKRELRTIDVDKNAESIYFPKDEDEIVGMNELEGQKMRIMLREKKVHAIKMLAKATGTLSPLNEISPEQEKMKEFVWFEDIRPKQVSDIFLKTKVKQEQEK